jgi:hypothetical protein
MMVISKMMSSCFGANHFTNWMMRVLTHPMTFLALCL